MSVHNIVNTMHCWSCDFLKAYVNIVFNAVFYRKMHADIYIHILRKYSTKIHGSKSKCKSKVHPISWKLWRYIYREYFRNIYAYKMKRNRYKECKLYEASFYFCLAEWFWRPAKVFGYRIFSEALHFEFVIFIPYEYVWSILL